MHSVRGLLEIVVELSNYARSAMLAACCVAPSFARLPLPRPAPPCRPAAEFDTGRITKPPRRTVGVPYAPGQDGAAWVAQVAAQLPNKAARVLVVSC